MDEAYGSAPVLQIENLTKRYANGRGVEHISLVLGPGEVCGLLGPNGSGKTTVMKAVAGLIRPDSGSIRICGADVENEYEQATGAVGCLIEAPALYGHLSAWKNLRLAASLRVPPEQAEEECRRVLRLTHLERYASDKASRFSLGMKQRLGIAIAVLGNPRLLVLDEPVNGLDIEGIMEVRELIRSLAAECGCTVLLSSHLAAELEKTCTRVAVLHEGELLCQAPLEEITGRGMTLEEFYLEQVSARRLAVQREAIRAGMGGRADG